MLTQATPTYGIRQISDHEVRNRTGLGWFEWRVALDSWEGNSRNLMAAIGYLKEKYGLNQHWAQIVATYYLLEQLTQ